MSSPTGQRLLRYDRRLGVRFVAGADEAGRGSLAGPLVVAGVLLDYERCTGHRDAAAGAAERLEAGRARGARGAAPRRARRRGAGVGARDPGVRHRPQRAPPLEPRGAARRAHRSRAAGGACLVDGFRLGPLAPPHRAVVDGDTRSAAIAAASIVAKVTRDRIMRRLDALYPRYGFSRHVGYITPGALGGGAGARAVRPASAVVRRQVLRAIEPESSRRGVNARR